MKKIFSVEETEEDGDVLSLYTKAPAVWAALHDLAQWVRELSKYSEDKLVRIEDLHTKFWEVMTANNIDPFTDEV